MDHTFVPRIFRTPRVQEAMAAVPISKEKCLEQAANLKDKVVVVTGAASGVGRAFSLVAVGHGAKIVAGDLSEAGLRELKSEIRAKNGICRTYRCNVCSWKDQQNLFQLAVKTHGRVDVVAPMAGVNDAEAFLDGPKKLNGGPRLQAPDLLPMDVNVTGVIYSVSLAAHYMRSDPNRGGKAIIMGCSMSSFFGMPREGVLYSASKHALLGLARSMHLELTHQGISISMIAPFFIDTPLLRADLRAFLGNTEMASLSDVVDAMVYAATQAKEANGSVLATDPSGNLSMPLHLLNLVHP